tara:strand:+ start:154 stop:366 length:213 start_codon:yes stop_codon:yes gene_type:complete
MKLTKEFKDELLEEVISYWGQYNAFFDAGFYECFQEDNEDYYNPENQNFDDYINTPKMYSFSKNEFIERI